MSYPRAVLLDQGVQLVTVDVLPSQKTSPAAGANGITTALWDPVDPGFFWMITAMSTSTTSTTATQLVVMAGNRVIDGSNSGNFDFSESARGKLVDSTEQLSATWYGMSPGAVGTLSIQYDLVQRNGG